MKIYDISQELLSSMVYEGDPSPIASRIKEIKAGEKYNLSAFYTCAHNGTHVDAPYHFINDGICVEEIPLEKTVGYAYVHTHNGDFVAEDTVEREYPYIGIRTVDFVGIEDFLGDSFSHGVIAPNKIG